MWEELAEIKAESAPARVRKVLAGLGFDDAMQAKPTKQFSGGWRMRIALARVLFIEPSLLLLDEPTNHLDLNATIWLTDFLKKWPKTLIVVSHDQEFLNQIVTDIIDVVSQKLFYYSGPPGEVYDKFKSASQGRRKEQIKQAEKERKEEQKEKKAASGSNKGGAKAKDKSKDKDGDSDVPSGPIKDYVVEFTFPQPPPLSLPIIAVEDVSFNYPGSRPLFQNLSTAVTMDSRIAMVGANGSGKSTLFKMLTRELLPLNGEVRHNARLKISVYNQHFVEGLPMELSPVKHLETMFPSENQQTLRKILGNFGLPSHAHSIKLKALSGGQKARVLFSQMALNKPDVIFLDEPTNHLDIESIDALVKAIQGFRGGVVVVSHDARLLMETECDLWVCGGCDPKKREASVSAPKKGGKKDAGPARARMGDDPEPFSGAHRFEGDFAAFAEHTLRMRDLGEV